jgi:hypothetical protein
MQKGRDFVQNGGWFNQGVGRLKSIREVEGPRCLFDSKRQQTIVDWRFRDDASGTQANMYTWTNEFAPPMDDPLLQERFKVRVAQARRHNESAKWTQ